MNCHHHSRSPSSSSHHHPTVHSPLSSYTNPNQTLNLKNSINIAVNVNFVGMLVAKHPQRDMANIEVGLTSTLTSSDVPETDIGHVDGDEDEEVIGHMTCCGGQDVRQELTRFLLFSVVKRNYRHA